MKPLDLSPEAIWRKRFRAADISWAVIAQQNPERGLVCTNRDGIYQLYAWNISTGELRQATHQPAGVIFGMISSDGNSLYFLKDQDGNEIGHYARVPFSGGEAEDISLYLYEVSTRTVVKLAHPMGTLGGFAGGYFAPTDQIWVTWEDSSHPSRLIALDAKTGSFKREVLKADDVPEGKVFQSITLLSENGDMIQGWLAVPQGDGPFPTILETHGHPG